MEPFSIITLLAAFGGGIIGTALGPLFAFIVCCFMLIVGIVSILVGGPDFILFQICLGPIFGIHAGGFGAPVVAATYSAGIRKNHPSETARDILCPLADTSWDVYLVGGIAAVLAHLLIQVQPMIPVINLMNGITFNIVFFSLLARALFLRQGIFGKKESIQEHGLLGNGGGQIAWLPWFTTPSKVAMFGLGAGLVSGTMAMVLNEATFAAVESGAISNVGAAVSANLLLFGMAGFSLILLNTGNGNHLKMPVFHGIALLAASGYLMTGSVIVAGVVGALSAVLQEFLSRVFHGHGDSHIDPPSLVITVGSLILNILFMPDLLNLMQYFN